MKIDIRNKNVVLYIAIIFVLFNCSGSGPIVDRKGIQQEQYEKDLSECETVSEEVSTTKAASKGLAAGAIIGGAIGYIFGGKDVGSKLGMSYGIQGAAASSAKAENEKDTVIKNCLRNRGYKVLN